jgi:hypothetical protein
MGFLTHESKTPQCILFARYNTHLLNVYRERKCFLLLNPNERPHAANTAMLSRWVHAREQNSHIDTSLQKARATIGTNTHRAERNNPRAPSVLLLSLLN